MKKITIITGASSGMGKEFAKQIASLKDSYEDEIWIIARREAELQALANEINSTKHFAVVRPVAMDIAGKEGVEEFRKLLEKESQELAKMESSLVIDKLINNAGFGTYGPFAETPVEKEIMMTELNCTSLVGFCGVALPYLKKGSIIINTASLASFLPLGDFAVYGATKAYVLSFSIALAAELKEKGIKVCALCPGPVSTEFANVASGGVREKVRHGLPADKVVRHCINKALKGKRIIIYAPKWKFKAAASRFVGRYTGAWFTYKFCKRPHPVPVKEEVLSPADFL